MATEFLELTHRGRGAISVVGLVGEDAQDLLDQCFSPLGSQAFSQLNGKSIVYGTWNSTGEDLVIARTANSKFEIQCHGSLAAVESIRADLLAGGALEAASSQAWTFANNDFQHEIAEAMQSSLTQRTARHLLQQFHLWGIARKIDPATAKAALPFAGFGQKLTAPWTVVLCGRPNVGKSSLINALAGFERAIVHPTAGTTRDLVSQHTAIDGWPIELIDSAGIREGSNPVEQAGIARAREVIDSADVVIHVVDATDDQTFDPSIDRNKADIVAVNKADLRSEPILPAVCCPVVLISAKTGQGLEELQNTISKVVVPAVPGANQLVPVTEAQRKLLSQL